MNIPKGRDSRVYTITSSRQVKSPPPGRLPRHASRVYQEVDRQVYQVEKDSTEDSYQERNHEVSPKRTSQDDTLLKGHLQVNAEYR